MPGTCLIPAALEEAPHPKLQNWSIDVNCNWCYHRLSSPNNHKIDGHWAIVFITKDQLDNKGVHPFFQGKEIHGNSSQWAPSMSETWGQQRKIFRTPLHSADEKSTSLEKRIRKQFSVPPRVAEKTRFFSVEKVGSLVVWWFGEVRLPHEISQKTKVSCRIATLDPFF